MYFYLALPTDFPIKIKWNSEEARSVWIGTKLKSSRIIMSHLGTGMIRRSQPKKWPILKVLKYCSLLVIQLFSRRLCLCHCLCIRLCLCICVPNSFLNSYYHKLSENVWVWGSRGSRSGDLVGCHHSGTDEQKRKDRATQPMDHGRLRWAILTPNKQDNTYFW